MLRDWRESLVLQRVRLLTEAEPVLVSLPLQLREQLPATSRVLASLNRLAELESTDAGPSAGDRLKLDRLAASRADIVAISARIKKLDAQIPALLKAMGCSLTAIHGVGVVTAMTLLAEVGDPHRFRTEARFARWCGVAPVAMSSGEGDGPPRNHRLDLGGNRKVNSVLHIVHVTQARCHPDARAYLTRRASADHHVGELHRLITPEAEEPEMWPSHRSADRRVGWFLHETFIETPGGITGYGADSDQRDLHPQVSLTPEEDSDGHDSSGTGDDDRGSRPRQRVLVLPQGRHNDFWKDFSMTGITGTRRIVICAVVLAVAAVIVVMMLASRPTSSAMAGMDHGSEVPPQSTHSTGSSGDMPGMDHGSGQTPQNTPTAPMAEDMPGMDHGSGDAAESGHGSGDTTEAAQSRPLAPVLGTFGGGTSAVLLTAGFLRRKDRAATAAKKAARDARRDQK